MGIFIARLRKYCKNRLGTRVTLIFFRCRRCPPSHSKTRETIAKYIPKGEVFFHHRGAQMLIALMVIVHSTNFASKGSKGKIYGQNVISHDIFSVPSLFTILKTCSRIQPCFISSSFGNECKVCWFPQHVIKSIFIRRLPCLTGDYRRSTKSLILKQQNNLHEQLSEYRISAP